MTVKLAEPEPCTAETELETASDFGIERRDGMVARVCGRRVRAPVMELRTLQKLPAGLKV